MGCVHVVLGSPVQALSSLFCFLTITFLLLYDLCQVLKVACA